MRLAAALVHAFTALGAVCALFAILAIGDRDWELAFLWLGVAFIIDGVDGTLARLVRIKETLPRFSGVVLDQVVDYLTYVLVPVLALLAAGLLPVERSGRSWPPRPRAMARSEFFQGRRRTGWGWCLKILLPGAASPAPAPSSPPEPGAEWRPGR